METQHFSYGYRLLLMLLIIGVNGFFAAAETALISVRPSRLRQMAEEGVVGAHAALSLLANPERLLSVSQVGLTLASLCLGWLGEETLYGLLLALFAPVATVATKTVLGVISLVFAFALMTFSHVVFGEVVPKNVSLEKPDRVAVLAAPILLVFYKLVEPFVWIIERAAGAVSRLVGVHGHHRGAHSPEELKYVLSASRADGHITRFEEEAMRRIVDLQEYNVRQVMVPRNQIVMVTSGADIDEVLQLMSESRYSRLPVCERQGENPIGFVHVKDVLDFWALRRQSNLRRRGVEPFRVASILRKAPIVPESRPLQLVFEDLRGQNAHLAFVVDEFGTVTGLVSIEDVFEQVFGEIEDEFDLQAQRPCGHSLSFEVEGSIPIRDLEMQYGIELPSGEEFETLAGYLLLRLGRIPVAGDAVDYGGHRLTVIAMEFNRVSRVRIDRAPPPAADSD
ncbi:MAG: HlyC/CorC family transporter [Acidobacteria bacterium]|nr:HlyC/CorC family transporter [Acidobacteriota bacterium]